MAKATKNSNSKKRKVERSDVIKEENLKHPLSEYADKFTNRLNDYIEGVYTKERKEDGTKKTKKDITKDTGISQSAMLNYTTDRLPRYTETIIMLKDYFDVSFSYLFGETPTTSIDSINIDIGIAYGLNGSSLARLKKLKKESENDSLDSNYKATIKLFLINSIINDGDFLEMFSYLVPTLIGRKQLDEKLKGRRAYVPFAVDKDFIDYLKYSAYEQYIEYINRLISLNRVPESIVKNSIAIATKYAGNRKKSIRFTEEQK